MTTSYVRGSFDIPLIEKTLGQAFDEAVERWPDREALVSCHEGIRWTWTELGGRVDDFAKGLWFLGFRPGDRLGVWATNQADWTVAQFATSKIGVILVNINPAYRPSELEYVLKKVGCKGLVTGDHFKSSNYIAMLQEVVPELNHCEPRNLQSENIPSLDLVIRLGEKKTPGMMNFSEVVKLSDEVEEDLLIQVGETLDPFEPINIQFTSGTTGAPKGATLSHHNILNNAKIIGDTLRYTPEDRICISVPLYHCFGMVAGNLPALTHGATMVYPGEVFEPLSILKALEQERCTSMYGVPTMYFAVIDHPDMAEYDVSSLRTGIMAGAPCPLELMKDAVNKLHMPEITIGYGMTETSPISFQSRVDDPIEKRVGTVGRVCPHTETKIVDEEGTIVPRGTQGEIITKGYLVMKGYWNDDEKTEDVISEDGWIHTGDLGIIDDEGWLSITGRLKDMVIRGGENVYPKEIEEYLYSHPQILEVQVFGVPDDKFGEEIAAWVKIVEGGTLSEEDLRLFCKGEIAYYKIPRYIRFVEEFPLTVTGKVQKFEMRNTLIEELSLAVPVTA